MRPYSREDSSPPRITRNTPRVPPPSSSPPRITRITPHVPPPSSRERYAPPLYGNPVIMREPYRNTYTTPFSFIPSHAVPGPPSHDWTTITTRNTYATPFNVPPSQAVPGYYSGYTYPIQTTTTRHQRASSHPPAHHHRHHDDRRHGHASSPRRHGDHHSEEDRRRKDSPPRAKDSGQSTSRYPEQPRTRVPENADSRRHSDRDRDHHRKPAMQQEKKQYGGTSRPTEVDSLKEREKYMNRFRRLADEPLALEVLGLLDSERDPWEARKSALGKINVKSGNFYEELNQWAEPFFREYLNVLARDEEKDGIQKSLKELYKAWKSSYAAKQKG